PKVAVTVADPPVKTYVTGTACAAPVGTSDSSPASNSQRLVFRAAAARRSALIAPPLNGGRPGAAERPNRSRRPIVPMGAESRHTRPGAPSQDPAPGYASAVPLRPAVASGFNRLISRRFFVASPTGGRPGQRWAERVFHFLV